MKRLCLFLLAPLTLAATLSASNTQIANGTPLWIDSQPDPEFSAINAKVDIGTLRQKGDAIEAMVRWPASPRTGESELDREQVVCTRSGSISFAAEITTFDKGGRPLAHKVNDVKAARASAESFARRMGGISSYGNAPPDLICWAASRKCDGKAFAWPPPPNLTPLEYSARAEAMRAAYNRRFLPSCKLPTR